MCAPRPVFISGGATKGDGWVDAKGMFLAAAGAGPVYKLLGKKDMGTTEFPPIETALIDGDVAFRQHSGGHTDAPELADVPDVRRPLYQSFVRGWVACRRLPLYDKSTGRLTVNETRADRWLWTGMLSY